MIKLVRLLLALVGVIVIVMLAVDNRGIVDIVFWPLPFTYRMPLYAVLLIGLFVGALLGGTALWLSSQRPAARDALAAAQNVRGRVPGPAEAGA